MENYEPDEQIGQGAHGIVYKAKHLPSGDTVAIKCINLNNEEEGVPCTAIREISLLKELKHPNIIRLLDVFSGESALSLVFECADKDLKNLMDEQELPPPVIKLLMRQLLEGLAFCHRKSVLHRDLKPQNLLIKGDYLKIADFGLGRGFGVPVRHYISEVVTRWYRSPDLLLGSTNYGTPVDMWSVGCIFAELCTNFPVFPGSDNTDQLVRIFRLMGTPNPEDWPSVPTYPNNDTLKAPQFNQRYPKSDLLSIPAFQKIGPQGVALLTAMLHYEPADRISADQALNHPYFTTADPSPWAPLPESSDSGEMEHGELEM